MLLIPRDATAALRRLARGFPAVAVTGPRQSGKTTLVRATFPGKAYISLEDPDERAFALADPRAFLGRFARGAILDEVQRAPELFSYLQTRVDERRSAGQFVLTGSQQFGLMANITQSLAGRVGLMHLLPFALAELKLQGKLDAALSRVLFRGLYPPVVARRVAPAQWYASYVATYVERDVRQVAAISRNGWTPIGRKTSRNCFGWSGVIPSSASPSCCSFKAAACSRRHASRATAR